MQLITTTSKTDKMLIIHHLIRKGCQTNQIKWFALKIWLILYFVFINKFKWKIISDLQFLYFHQN